MNEQAGIKDAGRDEVAGTNVNQTQGGPTMEPTLEDKQSMTPYQKLIRRSYGVSKITSARNLQTLRNEIRSLQSDLKVQVEEMNASVDSIEDDLDRLAQKDEAKLIKDQIERLDEVLVKVNDQVTELLSA
ncbi:MAG: hypothetical protein HOC69_03635 [Candidatus Marinimicrobia bacterium]|nr:hypothetical protein [Candidatus Neomarinimicrobiota bacterium]